ncbi:MAG: anaerobic carbon-monoxide dehydrogenase catalytic subunit [Candidatus Anammoxibacter sp.]
MKDKCGGKCDDKRFIGEDQVALDMLKVMKDKGLESTFDRVEQQQPQCGFGNLGLCCRHCQMGPCNIDPFGKGAKAGICGADANTIAARNYLRMIAAGTAAHSDHGREVAHLFIEVARGEAPGYKIKDKEKLFMLAELFEVKTEDRKIEEIAEEVGEMALAEFGKAYGTQKMLKRAPEPRQKLWEKLNIAPRAIDREVVEAFHRTGMGTDQDYKSLIEHAHRVALADGWGGAMIATELQDIMFGTPVPTSGKADIGIFKNDTVNIAIHGHEPPLAEMVAVVCQEPEYIKMAEEKGAKGGITIGGLCCTANEMLVRHGIPLAGHMKMQELVVATGAIEMMLVDVQCIMQADVDLCNKFHTKVITTSSKARMQGATHIEITGPNAYEKAKEIVKMAIDNYANRDHEKVVLPEGAESPCVVGFSHESIKYMLGGKFRASYRPLVDNIINGRIRGVAAVVGCVSSTVWPDKRPYVDLVNELVKNNILVIETGCAAAESARAGMMLPEYADHVGEGLREVCETVGMPPVLHAGSCVDNSRILIALSELVAEGGLGNDISELPAAGTCLDWMHEKALAIGHYFVASGALIIFGTESPVAGAPDVDKLLTEGLEDIVGGKWVFQPDHSKIAGMIIDAIEKKRDLLGINEKKERKLFDMEDRRKLAIETA